MTFTKIIFDLQAFNLFGVWRCPLSRVLLRRQERYDRCCNTELLHILGISTSMLLLEAPEFGRCSLSYVMVVFAGEDVCANFSIR